jgi:hypothetical protein
MSWMNGIFVEVELAGMLPSLATPRVSFVLRPAWTFAQTPRIQELRSGLTGVL